MGLLESLHAEGRRRAQAAFRDAAAPNTWTGMDAYLSVICFNTAEGGKANGATPAAWADLTKPEFKGKIVMPHPASSGTGYLTVAAWMQAMGEQKAWEFMDKLHDNIAVYTHSGSAPCVQAARASASPASASTCAARARRRKGAPLDLVLPTEGVGWDIEATGIVKGTKNLDAAKKLADWAASKKANELYAKYYALVAAPDVKAAPPNYPARAKRRW